jgi:type IX secretion system PorP/SprF family membrane protein
MKKLVYIFLFISPILYGQDIHFSQFNETPLLMNPALTGSSKGNFRLGLNYREQWTYFTNAYKTINAFTDAKFFQDMRQKENYLGLGFFMFKDAAGDGQLGNTQVGLSGAYCKELIEKHIFSMGFNASYGNRGINISELTWDSQYENYQYDRELSSGESFYTSYQKYSDLSAGISYKYNHNRYIKFKLGSSINHINSIKYSYSNLESDILKRKLIVHGDLSYLAKSTSIELTPSFLYIRQGPLQELLYGLNMKYQIKETNQKSKFLENYVCFGIHHRAGDSFILLAALSHKNTRVGISYDINSSPLSKASNYRGAVEISLIYHAPYTKRGGGSTLL